ncbi:MAG: response regulator [Bacteroidales bacterium]|nr:response regulator [Bacteroidales bacterium]
MINTRILFFRVIPILALLASVTGPICYAQLHHSTFEKVTIRDGLSQSTVTHILQDRHGFLWFATYDGINRYDGYSFQVFRHDEKDSTSLSHDAIVYMMEDSQGYIWIVNNGNAGLDRFDPRTEKFTRFRHNNNDPSTISSDFVNRVSEDRQGNIWVCTSKGLDLFVAQKTTQGSQGTFQRFYKGRITGNIDFAFENKYGQLLLFSDSLFVFNRKAKTFHKTDVPLAPTSIKSIVEDEYGNLYIGTTGDGILKLSYDQKKSTYQLTSPGKINVTPRNKNCLLIDKDRYLWIGTEDDGLYRYNPENDSLDHFIKDELDVSSISDNTIGSLFADHSGVLWIGTYSQGLCKYNLYRKEFMHYKSIPNNPNSLSGNVISSIHGIHPDELWVGNDAGGGLNRFIFREGKEPLVLHYKHDPSDPNSISGNSIISLVQRKNGEVWIGCSGGSVSKIIPEVPLSGRKPLVKRYHHVKWTFAIFEDSDGILWGGTWKAGLWRYDDKTDQFIFYAHDPENQHSLCDNIIWALGEDKNKNLWIGGHGNGISILTSSQKNSESPEFINLSHNEQDTASLSNNTINTFCTGVDGTLWIGTAGGLNRLLNETGIIKDVGDAGKIKLIHYHKKDGLPSEGIVGIVEDNSGNIWMSTANGLSRFNPADSTFMNFDEGDGLQNNEFWHNAYYKNTKGMLFFGGQNGFNAFYPDRIKTNSIVPGVAVTGLRLFTRPVTIGEKINNQVVLTGPLHLANKIALSHKNNIITIEFAALHYIEPAKNKYAYYLEGFEKDWNYIDYQRSATYTNLDPGRYVFRVKASNNDGVWNETGVALEVIIKPPWWKTWWFSIIFYSALIGLLFLLYYLRMAYYRYEQKKLSQLVKERTMQLEEVALSMEEKQEEINSQKEELLAQRDELERSNIMLQQQKEMILEQHHELEKHRNQLEQLVEERTRELIEAKERAEESDQLKSSFLANLSHEIRTPLNAILGFSALLGEEDVTHEDRTEYNRIMNNSSKMLLDLINDIMDISKIEAGQMTLLPVNVKLSRVISNIVDTYEMLMNRNDSGTIRKVDLKVNMAPDIHDMQIKADKTRLEQVLSNLMSNAVKFTSQGCIEIGCRRNHSTDMIEFYVKDTGIGIKEEYQAMIFERFRKVEDDKTQLYRGTGLGLAISSHLVTLMGGTMKVESQPGKGSEFSFTLPLNESASVNKSGQTEKKAENAIPDLGQYDILIAEDDISNFNYIKKLLQKANALVHHAENGRKVLEIMTDHPEIKLILMDIKMPAMDGIETLHELRKLNIQIPVIAQTAYALANDRERLSEEGFDEYISKPISAPLFYKMVAELLGLCS